MKASLVILAVVGAVAGAIARAESPAGFAPIGPLVEAAISRHELPGAVVLVGRADAVLYHAAFGQRAVEPNAEATTEDTIFMTPRYVNVGTLEAQVRDATGGVHTLRVGFVDYGYPVQ